MPFARGEAEWRASYRLDVDWSHAAADWSRAAARKDRGSPFPAVGVARLPSRSTDGEDPAMQFRDPTSGRISLGSSRHWLRGVRGNRVPDGSQYDKP